MDVGEYALYSSYRPPTNGECNEQPNTPSRDADATQRTKENPPSFHWTGWWLHDEEGNDHRDAYEHEGDASSDVAFRGRRLLGLEVSLRFLLAFLGPESVVLVLAVA